MQYFEPNFLDEALVLLDRFGSDARILAGGTRLGPQLRQNDSRVTALINVKRIDDLAAVEIRGTTLRIGALATAAQLRTHAAVRAHAPLLAAAAASMGARQLQNLATLGGNVCSGDPASDLCVCLLAYDARCEITTSSEGPVSIAVEQVLSKRAPVLDCRELLTAVEIPVAAHRWSYQKMAKRLGFEMALVAVALHCRMDGDRVLDARIGLAGAAPTPVRAAAAEAVLVGEHLDARAAREAARVAAEACTQPASDHRAGEAYRRHLVEVLTERAVLADGAPSGGND